MTDGLNQFRRCLICGAASPAECAGGLDPRRTFAEPCGPFALTMPHPMADAIWRVYGSGRDTPRIVGLTASDDTPRRGVPPYTPTEEQPTRIGGTEA